MAAPRSRSRCQIPLWKCSGTYHRRPSRVSRLVITRSIEQGDHDAGPTRVVAITGDIDAATAPEVLAELLEAGDGSVATSARQGISVPTAPTCWSSPT